MPTFETQGGGTLKYRVLPADTYAKIEAAIRAEWENEKPTPPIQRLETGPDEFIEKPHDKHPDYIRALAEFDQRVKREQSTRISKTVLDWATLTPTDTEAVKAFREFMGSIGVTYDESDRQVWLWGIMIPDEDEQATYTGKCLGNFMSALVEAQRRAFRRAVETTADRVFETTARE